MTSDKYKKAIVNLLLINEYLQYCSTTKRKIIFEHEGEILTHKHIKKIMDSYSKKDDERNWIKELI